MAAQRVEYVDLPYIGEPYRDSGYGRTLASLMQQRGDRQAAMHLRQGDIAAQGWANAGNAITNAISGWQRNVQENRQLELEAARESRRAEAEGIQIEGAKMDLGTKKRKEKGESLTRSLLPLARREDGLATYDRNLISREFEAAGMADQLPDVLNVLDEQDASHMKVLQARRDAVGMDAFRVLQSGADENTYAGLLQYWEENDALPPRELKAMQELGKDPEKRQQALMAAVQSSPTALENMKRLQEMNAPKLTNVAPGASVIDARNPEAGALFTAPQEPKMPTNIEQAILQTTDPDERARLIAMKEQFARAGRAPDVDRRAPVAVIGPDGKPVLMRPDDAIGKQPANTREQTSGAEIPTEYRNTLERAILNLPAVRRPAILQHANRLAADGNTEELADVIRQAAIEGENVDTKNQILGRRALMASLADTRAILEEMETKGVPTNILRGSVEDIARKLGTSSNEEYVELANRLQGTLINYRRAATGVAFGQREQQQYEKMFPNYKNTSKVNLALIRGLERETNTYDAEYWTHKLGKNGAALVGVMPAASKTQTTTQGGPSIGERRTIQGQLAEWDGKGWKALR